MPSPKSDKGKAKMLEFEDSNGNEWVHSLDNEYGGLDMPIMRTPGAKQTLTTIDEKLLRSAWKERTPFADLVMPS